MRRILCACMAFALLLGLTGCGTEPPAGEPTTVPSEPAPTQAATVPVETTVPTEPPLVEGSLRFTVSGITFSLVGESEGIYIGSIPAELVTWTSQDESVVTVENGILTAKGVGNTVVTAQYGDQRLECPVGCLAAAQEELMTLSSEILRAPKRLPPAVKDEPLTYYDDTAFVGDSISYIMFQWETMKDILGSPTFLVRGGTSLNGFVHNYKNIAFRGKEMPLEDAVAASGVKKVFIMLGQTDTRRMSIEDSMKLWEILLGRIREKSPDAEIYLQSCTPEGVPDSGDNQRNSKIDEYNIVLKEYAQENGYHYLDIAYYIEDHMNAMAESYAMDDDIHLNEQGCTTWMQVLKAYAQLQESEGE